MNSISNLLGLISPSLSHLHGGALFVFLLVLLSTTLFLVIFPLKSFQVWREISSAIKSIRELRRSGVAPDPSDIDKIFNTEPMKHIWGEYSETLHKMQIAGAGDLSLSVVRATIPAETMFTREVLVEGRLFDEFVRHLPGVLTGLGIIGTFVGLLDGLQQFRPTPVEDAVNGLGPLLQGVQHAFVASATAISCAMMIVFISRLVLAFLYKQVEKLNHTIDSLYLAGAGEEYLSRLVKSAEQNAASTAQLKDALVEDLRTMMTNLVDRQIAAHETATVALGERIGNSISDAIAEPMRRVGEAMENTSRGNGEQVSSMMETLLTGFMAKLEDTFGGQMRGINEQMQRSMDSMSSVQASLQSLLADIQQTNEHAASQMSGTLEEAMKKAADNQQILTDQMREFVQDFRQLVTDEQNKSKQVMDEAVMKVLSEVTTAMGNLEEIRKAASIEEANRHGELANQTSNLVGGLSTQVESLLGAVSEQVSKTQSNIKAIEDVSLKAINGMNQGALTMGNAARQFETAGNSVSDVFKRAGTVTEALNSAAAALQVTSTAVQRGFEQYDQSRKTVDAQVAALMGLIESVKKEAGVSKDLVASIKSSADSMRAAEEASRAHLEQVNQALVKAFSEFGNAMLNQVKTTIAETDRHLSQGTGHLNGVVQELATAVQRMKRA